MRAGWGDLPPAGRSGRRSGGWCATVGALLVPVALVALAVGGCGGGHQAATAPLPPAFGTAGTSGAASAGPGSTGPGSAGPGPAVPDDYVNALPVRRAQTSEGVVAYRSVGFGAPVLLIMGFAGSMDAWPPSFVAGLATHHRVVVFDDAGVGDTAALPYPLTVPAMAGQTAALVRSLGLAPVEVIGWGVGGMVAQSLAVADPAAVGSLVLAATLPGTGTGVLPPPGVLREMVATTPGRAHALALLYPPSQAAEVGGSWLAGVFALPGYHGELPQIALDQLAALQAWVAGDDAAGRELGRITAPTVVADGADDVLVPAAADAALAAAIPGARRVTVAGAGAGFLFQDPESISAP